MIGLGRSVGRSDTGRRRRHNEDSFVLQPPLFAVADGMGGALAGELASRLAVEAVERGGSDGGGAALVTRLVQAANLSVYERSHTDSSVSGMGTTMTLALVEGDVVTLGHVGDSRAYLFRGETMQQVTNDHSLVAELVRSGKLTAEEAEHHPQRSVITRALGTDPDVDVDTYTVDVQPGDVFLLCSDGLTSMVGDQIIHRTVLEHRHDLDTAARELIALANRGGGEDNITVVCFDIAAEGDGDRDPAETTVATPIAQPEPDDEDTIPGLERVPAVSTMVVSPDELEELTQEEPTAFAVPQSTPAPPVAVESRRPPRLLVGLAAVAVAAILALVVWGLLT